MNKTVLMVCSQYPPVYGGAGQQASLLATKLAALQYNVTIITLDQDSAGTEKSPGLRIVRILKGVAPRGPFSRLVSTVALGLWSALHVLLKRPAAVHVHGAYWWSIPPVLAARWIGSVTLVKITRDGEDDPVTIVNKRIFRFPVGRLYSLAIRKATYLIALNDDVIRASERAGLRSKTLRINNGVDSALFSMDSAAGVDLMRSAGVGSAPVVLYVGYMARHKGVFDLVEAWPATEISERAELWLVGPSTGFYRELGDPIEREVEKLQALGYNIKLFGKRPASELPEFYRNANVFVLPSYAEGMPNSLAEAIVAGCRIVATRLPGIEAICPANESFLVQPGDRDSLAEALDAVFDTPRETSEETRGSLDIDRIVQRYAELYERNV